MNPRERTMVIALGAIMGLLVLITVKNQYVKKLSSLDEDIRKYEDQLKQIELEKLRVAEGKKTWQKVGRQTLGIEENRIQTVLRPDIDALVQETGLEKSTVALRSVAKIGNTGLKSLGVNVGAEGKLDQIIEFLFKVHQRPYLLRCQTLRLNQVVGKDVPKHTLRLSADLDTILLPVDKNLPLPKVEPVDVASQPAPVQRTKLAELDDYKSIIKRKMFQAWEPPPPLPVKVAGFNPPNDGKLTVNNQNLTWGPAAHAKGYDVFFGEQDKPAQVATTQPATNYHPPKAMEIGKTYYYRVDSVNAEGKTKGDVIRFTVIEAPRVVEKEQPKQPPPPPPDQNLILARIVSSPRGQQVVLQDPQNQAAEDKRIEVGDALYGGTLIFVHPKGAVSEKENQRYFHPLTKALRECQPLNDQTQPELVWELLKLEQRAAGISQKAG